MLGSIGLPELIFIFVLALLIFGPKRLPEIGRTLGKGLSEFRRASNDLKRTIDSEILAADDERRLPGPPGAAASLLTGPARALAEVNSALQAVVAPPAEPQQQAPAAALAPLAPLAPQAQSATPASPAPLAETPPADPASPS